MVTKDPRIDAYIASSADCARPILTRLRALVHATCPEVVETVKWRNPSFEYQGLLCGMAAFKKYCAFGFWKHELVLDEHPEAKKSAGSFGALKTVADVPPRAQFAAWMRTAMRLNEQKVTPRRKASPKARARLHPRLKSALAANEKAGAAFAAFSPGAQREYLEWIGDAKTEATRTRRIAQAIPWIAQGKRRNWKYERK